MHLGRRLVVALLPSLATACGSCSEAPAKSITLAGRIVSIDDTPVRGAKVTTIDETDGYVTVLPAMGCIARMCVRGPFVPNFSTTTDQAGRFVLHDVPPGVTGLRVEHEEFAPFWAAVDHGELDTELFRLHHGATVAGRFALPADLAYCQVAIGEVQAAVLPGFCASTISDPTGRFAFGERVPPGDYQVWFTAPDTFDSIAELLAAPQWRVPLHVPADQAAVFVDTGAHAAPTTR